MNFIIAQADAEKKRKRAAAQLRAQFSAQANRPRPFETITARPSGGYGHLSEEEMSALIDSEAHDAI